MRALQVNFKSAENCPPIHETSSQISLVNKTSLCMYPNIPYRKWRMNFLLLQAKTVVGQQRLDLSRVEKFKSNKTKQQQKQKRN